MPGLGFLSSPRASSPSWHTVKVRVQGSCILCAHCCALFIPNPTFFSYCARMERSTTKVIDMDFLWFDSMKRSEEGTMKWQWGLHVTLTGTAVVTPALKWHDWKHSGDALTRTRTVPLSLAWPHLVPNWPKCLFKSVQSIATVWAESQRLREKLLLISPPTNYPEITRVVKILFFLMNVWRHSWGLTGL